MAILRGEMRKIAIHRNFVNLRRGGRLSLDARDRCLLHRFLLDALHEEQPAGHHAHRVENQRPQQVRQVVIPFRVGEDLSHDVNYSDDADDPEQDAGSLHQFFHIPASSGPHGLDEQPQREHSREPVEQIRRKGLLGRPFSAENFRHGVGYSGKRYQPDEDGSNPPQHDIPPNRFDLLEMGYGEYKTL